TPPRTPGPRTRTRWSGRSARPAPRCTDQAAGRRGSPGCRSRTGGCPPRPRCRSRHHLLGHPCEERVDLARHFRLLQEERIVTVVGLDDLVPDLLPGGPERVGDLLRIAWRVEPV